MYAFRNRIWVMQIIIQVGIIISPTKLINQLKREISSPVAGSVPNDTSFPKKQKLPTAVTVKTAKTGIPPFVVVAKILGPCPALHRAIMEREAA